MFKIRIKSLSKAHRFEELVKIFLPPEDFIFILDQNDENGSRTIGIDQENEFFSSNQEEFGEIINLEYEFKGDNNLLSRQIYKDLRYILQKESPWGTMTGIRPVRLFRNYIKDIGKSMGAKEVELASNKLREEYLVGERKLSLVNSIYRFQEESFKEVDKGSLGLYIGIPFCPTKCYYCSFTSNVPHNSNVNDYLDALIKEIEFCGEELKNNKFFIESLYIGGGTPTTLDSNQLNRLLMSVFKNFDLKNCVEITVEAGRADTIDEHKLRVIKSFGINRISVNPQTMNDEILVKIGRNHNSSQMEEAFNLARTLGFSNINCDLIAGLPGENLEDFKYTIDKIVALAPENITVHTLSIKRSSKFKEKRSVNIYEGDVQTQEMLEYAYDTLGNLGYKPYYMYRQKNMLGLGENVGFSKEGYASLYNYRIMEENQTILALGAGGISKLYFPKEDRLERIANVSNFQEYIKRIDEMVTRKRDKFFKEAKDVN